MLMLSSHCKIYWYSLYNIRNTNKIGAWMDTHVKDNSLMNLNRSNVELTF